MQVVEIGAQKVAIGDLYPKENIKQVQDAWTPILKAIANETASIKTFKSEITPDGLLGRISEGSSLLMCCFPVAQLPRFIGVHSTQEQSRQSRATALLQESRYLSSVEEGDEK